MDLNHSIARKLISSFSGACKRGRLLLHHIYQNWGLELMAGPLGVWQECRQFQIEFLLKMGLQPYHALLDVGCGPLRGGIPLIRFLDPGHYVGVDIRQWVIAKAHREVAREGLGEKKPELIVSSIFGRDELENRAFDFIWCFQILYHLEDPLADTLLAQVKALLKPEGVCFANVNTFQKPGRWWEFPFVRRSLEFYEQLARKHGMKMENLGRLRDLGYTTKVPGQFGYMLRFREQQPKTN